MKIKDLPKGIKKKAKEYAKRDFPNKEYRPDDLASSFRWGSTKEGHDYWKLVDDEEFLKAEELLVKKAKEELEKLKEENPLLYMSIQDLRDAGQITESTIKWSEEGIDRRKAFFLDEVLDIQVNNVEVVPYKEELEVIDPIVEAVREKLKQRSSIGIKKYGTTLDRDDLSLEQWLDHAIEEAMDLCLYLTKIKEELKKTNRYDSSRMDT